MAAVATAAPRSLAASELGHSAALAAPAAPLAVASVAISSQGGLSGTGTVSLVDTQDNALSTPVRLSSEPIAIAVSANGHTVFAVGAGNDMNGVPGSITTVNTLDRKVGRVVNVQNPVAVAVPPAGNTVYVLGGFDAATQQPGTPSNLTPVDTATGTMGKVVKVASMPAAMAITPDGKTIYVVGADAVTPVATAGPTVGAAIKLQASGVVLTPKTAFFVCPKARAVVPVTISGERVGKAIGTGLFVPQAAASSPAGQAVYVVVSPAPGLGGGPDDKLLTIDPATDSVVSTVALGAYSKTGSWALAVTPNGKTVYVLGLGSATSAGVVLPVSVGTPPERVAKPISAGLNSAGIAVAGNGVWAYVLDAGIPPGAPGSHRTSAGSIVPIEIATGTAGKPISLPAYAQVMAAR